MDASVLVDALVGGASGAPARAALREVSVLSVPAIFTAEATSAIRALERRGAISLGRARAALSAVASVRTSAHPFEPFLARAWELRSTITVYDAWYVALAEALDAELLTADRRLASASGPRCVVQYVGPG